MAGLLAGTLGVGGGIVIVPLLSFIFLPLFPTELLMHMAVGSSFAVMIFTTLSSAYSYYRRELIDWSLFYRVTPGLILGIVIGSLIAMHLSSQILHTAFGLFLLIIALYLLLSKEVSAKRPLPKFPVLLLISMTIGILSGFFGVSGGTMIVPFFMYCMINMRVATGTSSVCSVPIAIVGTSSLILTGWQATHALALPPWTTGFVYWPAVFPIAFMSVLCAPIGTFIAAWLPIQTLKNIFCIVLIIVAMRILI